MRVEICLVATTLDTSEVSNVYVCRLLQIQDVDDTNAQNAVDVA